MRVQPGVVQEDLNRAAKRFGLGFGPDTSTSNRATLGGMIGNNSSGSESVVYGTTIDHVLELDVVLADGTRATFAEGHAASARARRSARCSRNTGTRSPRTTPKHWRQSGGYRLDRLDPFNLAKLIVGSEGTLALVTSGDGQAGRAAEGEDVRRRAFRVRGATRSPPPRPALALGPSAVEMIDRKILSLSRSKLEYRRLADRLEGDPGALLFVSFAGDTDDEVRAKLDALEWDAYHTIRAETAADQADLTKVRKAGLGLLMAASEGRRRPAAFVEDTAVAPERLGEYVARFGRSSTATGSTPASTGTARSAACTSGRTSTCPTGAGRDAGAVRARSRARHEFDGVNSSEHGDGRIRSPFNPRIFGDELYGAMRKVKGLFDPGNLLNPGVMVDPEPMTAHLRDAELPQPKVARDPLPLPRGQHARRRRPLPADRRVPQDRLRA